MTLTITSTSLPFLAKPSTGWDLFSKPPEKPTSYPLVSEANDDAPTVGPRRAIASRGTEIFVARGNEVRVADLQDLKARQPAQQSVEGYREYKVRSFSYSLRGKCCWFLAVDGRANRSVV
jgi:nucleoporin NUP82